MEFTVLECKRFVAPSAKKVIKRTVYDYEFDFHIKGGRRIFIDGNECIIKSGDISVRRPGQTVYSCGDYDCYILTLDFSGEKNSKGYSRNAKSIVQPSVDDMTLSFLPNVVSMGNYEKYIEIFSELSLEDNINSDFSKDYVRRLLYMMNLDAMYGQVNEGARRLHPVYTAYKYINENYREKITLAGISEIVHLDPSYLSRIFKRKFGFSPLDYAIRLRLDHAASLLFDTDMTVSEIAGFCGYINISFFVSAFKKRFGCPRGEYRLRMHLKSNLGNNT